jgi:Holliday junction DNA helicase RuvB
MIESNAEEIDRIVTAKNIDPNQFENKLRPHNLEVFVGQSNIKDNLGIAIKAAKKRKEPLDHVLLHGSPGLGKTTLAVIIANETGVNIRITSGPALEKQGDVASIISNLQENDILFIDEIHRLKPVVEEVLYTAMEDFGIDIVIGKGPSARTMRINLPRFTLIGATTKMSMLSSPLRDRFGNVFRLQFYNDSEIKQIILRSAKILNCKIDDKAADLLSKSCRKTPRIANRLLKRCRDFAEVKDKPIIDIAILKESLKNLGIDDLGLDHVDREMLATIIDKFNGGPVGLNTLSAATGEEQETIEDIYEPFLIQIGFLERTSRGRIATQRAYDHLKVPFRLL